MQMLEEHIKVFHLNHEIIASFSIGWWKGAKVSCSSTAPTVLLMLPRCARILAILSKDFQARRDV